MAGRSMFDTQQRRKDFSSSLCVQTGSEAHPASCTMGTGGPFPRAKARPGRDADHSPPSSARSRMSRSYTSSPLMRLHGMLWDSFSLTISFIKIISFKFHKTWGACLIWRHMYLNYTVLNVTFTKHLF
jgi:hypothetical protein